jgi:hypothetical protein
MPVHDYNCFITLDTILLLTMFGMRQVLEPFPLAAESAREMKWRDVSKMEIRSITHPKTPIGGCIVPWVESRGHLSGWA